MDLLYQRICYFIVSVVLAVVNLVVCVAVIIVIIKAICIMVVIRD